jgi:two-component system, NtrC family, response regulator HydG
MTDRGGVHVLLVEDDEAGRRSAERYLRDSGFKVTAVGDGEQAEALFREDDFSVLVADYRLPGIDGIELLRRVKACRPACPGLLVTAHGDVRSAVEAMRAGAVQFVEKPVQPALLVELIDEAWEKHALQLEVDRLRRQLDERYGFHQIVGTSPAMETVFQRIKLAAPTSSTILITGESGTGKEVVARALHQNSLRKHGPFVAINCAALPDSLVEAELFGHEKGAFTGAQASRKGFFEAAEHGTLLIDEIGDMPLALQPKLLRALEQRSINRVGSTREVAVDVRIIAATHQRLEERVEAGSFRADLYYRLAVLRIDVPPLRQRREDIPLLLASFLQQLSGDGAAVRPISPEALAALCRYGWPGNVRELRNVAESLVVMSSGRIELEDLPENVRKDEARAPRPAADVSPGADAPAAVRLPTLAEVERRAVLEVLAACGGNRTRAAQVLGIGLRTIQRKLREYGVE